MNKALLGARLIAVDVAKRARDRTLVAFLAPDATTGDRERALSLLNTAGTAYLGALEALSDTVRNELSGPR